MSGLSFYEAGEKNLRAFPSYMISTEFAVLRLLYVPGCCDAFVLALFHHEKPSFPLKSTIFSQMHPHS